MTLIIHLLSSLLTSIPWMIYEGAYPKESWLIQVGLHNMTAAGILTVYLHSFLMTCCYFFFGVSHGGVVIAMPNEEITMFMVSLLGRLYTSFMIADILRYFGLATVSESEYDNIMTSLNEYVSSKCLPPYMRKKLVDYCRYKFQGHYVNEKEIFKTLPERMRKELLVYFAKDFLAKMSIFQVLPRDRLGTLIADMRVVLYAPGDMIAKEDGVIECVYFIKRGTVALYHEDDELCHLEDGHALGDICYVLPDSHFLFTYIAVDYTELYTLYISAFKRLLKEYGEVKRYFEAEANKKIKLFQNLKRHRTEGTDILAEIKGDRILEHLRLRPGLSS
nr:unnamed protein product [Callosobruchus analis]